MPKGKSWTEDDDRVLIEEYSIRGVKHCSAKLNRSQGAVMNRAMNLGICRRGRVKDLTLSVVDGYYVIKGNGKTIFLHRMIMEHELGRKLTSDDIVHHVDGDRKNNNPENLSLETRSTHMKHHCEERRNPINGQFT